MANDGVHEHVGIGVVAQLPLQVGVQLSAFDRSRYRDMDKSIAIRFILQSHGVSYQLYGVYECFWTAVAIEL